MGQGRCSIRNDWWATSAVRRLWKPATMECEVQLKLFLQLKYGYISIHWDPFGFDYNKTLGNSIFAPLVAIQWRYWTPFCGFYIIEYINIKFLWHINGTKQIVYKFTTLKTLLALITILRSNLLSHAKICELITSQVLQKNAQNYGQFW